MATSILLLRKRPFGVGKSKSHEGSLTLVGTQNKKEEKQRQEMMKAVERLVQTGHTVL